MYFSIDLLIQLVYHSNFDDTRRFFMKRIFILLLSGFVFSIALHAFAGDMINVPILVYHNLDPSKRGSMTISTAKFESQIKWLKENDYTVIPLIQLVDYLQGKTNSLPVRSVVITDDDGRESVYRYMLPLVQKYNIPVTLFIYPAVISKAPYAMTWAQLATLEKTGLFNIQSHTIWHPNFKQEKKRLSEKAYQKLVMEQLSISKTILTTKLNSKITLLAWPFGIYDHYLEQQAEKAGYVMAFSIAAKNANRLSNPMAVPRFMIVEDQSMGMFEAIVKGRVG